MVASVSSFFAMVNLVSSCAFAIALYHVVSVAFHRIAIKEAFFAVPSAYRAVLVLVIIAL